MLSAELGVREGRYGGAVKDHAIDVSSPALWRDPNKCVLCGRCVTMCHTVQGIGAIDFVGRGFRTKVVPGFGAGLNVSDCVYCGQCARVCPTGAIVERSHVEGVVAALADPDTVVVAQVAPAVPATLLERRDARRRACTPCSNGWPPPSRRWASTPSSTPASPPT